MRPVGIALGGGGIRGGIQALFLEAVQKRLGTSIIKLHPGQLALAGTSAGAINATALALGLDPDYISGIYFDRGHEIFPHSRLRRLFSLVRPKYSHVPLEDLLKEAMQYMVFGQCRVPTLVTAFRMTTRRMKVFKSFEEEDGMLFAHDVVRASAAAPTFFPAKDGMVDGGVALNNPSMALYAEMKHLFSQECQPRILFIGCGTSQQYNDPEKLQQWGLVQWLPHLADVFMESGSDSINYQARTVMGEDFLEVPVDLGNVCGYMDSVKPGQLRLLREVAEDTIDKWASRAANFLSGR